MRGTAPDLGAQLERKVAEAAGGFASRVGADPLGSDLDVERVGEAVDEVGLLDEALGGGGRLDSPVVVV